MTKESSDQSRRASKKRSVTLDPVNEDFLKNELIPANPSFKKHHLDKGYTGAINACIKAVRMAWEEEKKANGDDSVQQG